MKKLVLFLLIVMVAACGGEEGAEKPTIQLAENPWTGSAVNNAVAQILLQDELGYEVEVVTIDENSMWPALADGSIDAVLEVWPSGHGDNLAQYVDGDEQLVERLGELGVIGKIGWFMPAYMVEQNPAYATWEGFLSDEAAADFATAQTGELGQFLAGDPSFVQYDADIIENLGMPFEVVYAGSEQAQLAALDAAYSREEGFLFYFWTPHSAFADYDLVNVELPAYSDACWADPDGGSVDCDYPEDTLLKLANPELDETAPEAHQLLENLTLSNEDQIGLIAAVDEGGQTPQEAAREWVDANEDVWRAWLP